ncbi:hypothetical protein T06_15157 [Trichinella sp. T6]|nr:hypothetical protein T06_15157 [Trichinella sp. T6]
MQIFVLPKYGGNDTYIALNGLSCLVAQNYKHYVVCPKEYTLAAKSFFLPQLRYLLDEITYFISFTFYVFTYYARNFMNIIDYFCFASFLKESEGLYEICKIGNKYEITAERLFLHDFMDYFHCNRFLFFKTAGDFLYLCNIHRIVENSREPCTPPSQK